MNEYRVGVIGAGTMGAGIALVCARQGYSVKLLDANEETLERAKQYFHSTLTKDVTKGKISEEQKAKTIQLINPIARIEELHDRTIIVEAVPERLELKKSLFQQLAKICSEKTLLLSNTSSISITAIAGSLAHPERVLGLHFFNPAPVMPLVEVIRGKQSSEENVQATYQFAKKLAKVPVMATDTPGFIVNRVARPYYNEALRILGDGVAEVEQIDRIMKRAGGFKMGPFELQDMIGIDINFATTQTVFQDFFYEGRFKPSRIQERMVQAGNLGRKTGEGFYDYS
ncbi:3-hydroxyacyl-CoA dehydrogenase NAD-binding domain-containing protein [Brevibacillus daliensis]|uniref:3-hydroxyacyl-CoA dehydrogenase NAD-binding domain-containing protein n=1 Tax=Brevibacillus daliensis TaxID=2892995 RepID=UPI001E64F3B8|nr:3-hydroxyacyl-CoA dehydrogenase NAD-binding domain-containing protein [Brevibacillus daliensis]